MTNLRFFSTLMLALFLMAAAFSMLPNAGAQGNTPCYGSQGGAEMVAGNGCTYTFESGSRIKNQPKAMTLTNNKVISNAYNTQLITIASNVTATITTTGYITGDALRLVNNSNFTLLVADSNPVKASGNISLGQYDTADLWFNGTYWLQTGESDN